MSKRIAVIGSGVSGLTAVKSCLEEGLTPVCFERSNHIGGLWRYTEEVKDGQGSVMKSTVINTSKEVMAYSDFPIPGHFPVFMHNTLLHKYLEMYAERFDVTSHVRFGTEIASVRQAESFGETGQWELQVRDNGDGTTSTEVFDGVMVCTGHHAKKSMPSFEGLEKFRGKVVHAHEYRSHVGYEDKRVVIVGIGNSGSDIAVELSKITKQVYVSTRKGTWVTGKLGHGGLPLDVFSKRRYRQRITSLYPRWLRNYLNERKLNARFDHSLYGLQPEHRVDQQHPTGGDDLPNRIASGTVLIRPNIKGFTETGVEFVDGRTAEDIDVVIFATGYKIGFPFIEHPALEVKENVVNLYKFVFPPDIQPPTLAVVGCVQPGGSIVPLSEIQSRWATRVFKGSCDLPSGGDMWLDIKRGREATRKRFVESLRHTIEVDYTGYMDDLAKRIGCMPDIGKLVWSDPRLAAQCYFGTSAPYMYRLTGPGKWEGAREAMMTVMDRTLAGIEQTPQHRDQSIPNILYTVVVFVFCVLLRFLLCV